MNPDLTTDSEIIMNLFENDHNSSSTSNSTHKNRVGNNTKNITNNNNIRANNSINQTPTPFTTESNNFFPSSLANSIMNSTPLNFMKQYPLPNQFFLQGQLNQPFQPQPQQGVQPTINFNFESPQFDNFFNFTPNKTQKFQVSNQKPQSRPHSRAQQQFNHHRPSLASQRSQFIPNDATFGLSTPLANKSSISIFDTPYFNNLFMNTNPNNFDSNQMINSNTQFSRVLMNVDTPLLDSIEKVLINSTPLPRVNNQKIKKLNNSNTEIDDFDTNTKETSFNRDNSCIYKVIESRESGRCQDIIQIPSTNDLEKSKTTPKRKTKSESLVSSTPVKGKKVKQNFGIDDSFVNSDENKNNIIINSSPSTIVVSSASKSVTRFTLSNSLNVEASPTPINKFNNYSHSMSFNMNSMNSIKNFDFNIDPSLQSNNIPEAPVMGVFKEKKNRTLSKHPTFPLSQNGKDNLNESKNLFSIQTVDNNHLQNTTKKLNRSKSMPDSITDNKIGKKRKNGTKGAIQFVMTDVTKLKGHKKRRVAQPKKVPLSNTTNIINNTNNTNLKEGKLEIHKRLHTFKTKSEPQFINQEFKEKENVNM